MTVLLSACLNDTRPYPTDPVKNDLLLYAQHLAEGTTHAQQRLAQESLQASLRQMLAQNHYLGLSVALAMAGSPAIYRALWQNLDTVLQAQTAAEIQWYALPVVLVLGATQTFRLPESVPTAAIDAVLASSPQAGVLPGLTWWPQWLDAATLAQVTAGQWWQAKQNSAAAQAWLDTLPESRREVAAGQSVQVVYALACGPTNTDDHWNRQALQQAALPLMQVWQQHFATQGVTLFANPLPWRSPLTALAEGGHMRLRMAAEVFAANAIRAVRLQSPRVGVVIAAQEGGQLLFGFNATDSAFELASQVFTWPLSPLDDLEEILQHMLQLLSECQVEHIRLLHEPLAATASLPAYAAAVHLPGINPLFMAHQ